ncbi:F-box/kelch-repeat protein At3g23880-like [Bidens hawaiensis]|uniref:F-box/kelch-repeat protein At3g23880-like n=1 Tax=Bidens hawaiensis TaxID=980011 RepID=UPI0040497CF8
MGDQFPPDVIYEIFSRLPIKSLARFRCVCKSWLKYINHPYLQTIHRFKEEPTPIIFQLVPSANSNKNSKLCKISVLRVNQLGTITIEKDHVLDVPYKGWSHQTPVLGSCNGLTLVLYEKTPWHGTLLTLINPVTKQRHDLPPVKLRDTEWDCPSSLQAAGIGFDDSTNTLTTVFVLCKESFWSPAGINPPLCTMVHRLGMSSWREMPQTPALPICDEGVFAHGRLHWLSNSDGFHSANDGRKVVWFDVKMEEFGLTDAPKGGQYGQLVDLNGEVGFAYKDDGIHIELWVLKREEWVLRCRFDLDRPRHIDVVVCGCWNDDGDILLTSNGGKKRLFVYTLKTDDLKEVKLDGRCEAYIRMHRSSLFSIRGQNYK